MPVTKLPFTHGIEMEVQIVRNDGRWIDGSHMPGIFREIVDFCHYRLLEDLKGSLTPLPIKRKLVGFRTAELHQEKNNRGHTLIADYRLGDRVIPIEIVSRDAHGAGVTWILEIVTPPCEFIEELDWWCHRLFRASRDAIAKRSGGLRLISAGLNPLEDFSVGISFGDHHHIGIPDPNERIAVYNMLRNYIPHLIAMTVNSPIEGGKFPALNKELVKANKFVLANKTDPMSIRLLKNTNQLGPSMAGKYIPYLHRGSDARYFQSRVEREPPRMVDMYPFTKFGTIEIRVFDAQLTTRQRLAVALLIQAIALRARGLYKARKRIPCPSNRLDLMRNREMAISRGPLIGMFKDESLMIEPDPNIPEPQGLGADQKLEDLVRVWGARPANAGFVNIYRSFSLEKQDNLHYILESCQNLVLSLKPEFQEMRVLDTPYLDPLIMVLWGPRGKQAAPPLTPGHYQLFLLSEIEKAGADARIIMPRMLARISDSVADQPDFDPAIARWGRPAYPRFLKPVNIELHIAGPETLYAGKVAELKIQVSNFGTQVRDALLKVYTIDSAGATVNDEKIPLPAMGTDSAEEIAIEFPLGHPGTKYYVEGEVVAGEKVLAADSWTGVAATVNSIIKHVGPDAYLVSDTAQPVQFLVTLGSTFPSKSKVKVLIELVDEDTKQVLNRITQAVEISPHSTLVLAPEPLFGRTHDEIRRMTSREMDTLGEAESELFLIKGMALERIDPLLIPITTGSCHATVQANIVEENGTSLNPSYSKPFQIATIGTSAPPLGIEVEILNIDDRVNTDRKVAIRCRAKGSPARPVPLTAFWSNGRDSLEATRWTVEKDEEEKIFSVPLPDFAEDIPIGKIRFFWADESGKVVGEDSIEIETVPVVDIQLQPDPASSWPWIQVNYTIFAKVSEKTAVRWSINGEMPRLRNAQDGGPCALAEKGTIELLLPEKITKEILDGASRELVLEMFENGQLVAQTSASISINGLYPNSMPEEISSILLKKLVEEPTGSVADGGTAVDIQSFILGIKGNHPIYNGAIIPAALSGPLEYNVKTRWRGKEEPASKIGIYSYILAGDGSRLHEEASDLALAAGIGEVGPYKWVVPDDPPNEVKLVIGIRSGENRKEKSYTLKIDKNTRQVEPSTQFSGYKTFIVESPLGPHGHEAILKDRHSYQ